MKLLVVLVGVIAVCSGNAIPLVPGDNSHYVEGESRYIWMPDGEGIPHLVDLQEPADEEFVRNRNGTNNQYWLFTRANPTTPQIITHGNAASIANSNFVAGRPTKVVVHGWNGNGNSGMNPTITNAFLSTADCNVIVVDWRDVANSNYLTAVLGVPGVGQFLGNFLVWLFDTAGGNWNTLHLVGFSLGAHVVGNAGRTAGSRPGRVTGLDPAGPLWGGGNTLAPSDGIHVENIHTDGGLLGIMSPIGNADFYPNGGRNPQPGCNLSTCSHSRAPDFFAASVHHNHFIGNQCANLAQAEAVTCTGSTLNMGNGFIPKQGFGLFALRTGSSWPF